MDDYEWPLPSGFTRHCPWGCTDPDCWWKDPDGPRPKTHGTLLPGIPADPHSYGQGEGAGSGR